MTTFNLRPNWNNQLGLDIIFYGFRHALEFTYRVGRSDYDEYVINAFTLCIFGLILRLHLPTRIVPSKIHCIGVRWWNSSADGRPFRWTAILPSSKIALHLTRYLNWETELASRHSTGFSVTFKVQSKRGENETPSPTLSFNLNIGASVFWSTLTFAMPILKLPRNRVNKSYGFYFMDDNILLDYGDQSESYGQGKRVCLDNPFTRIHFYKREYLDRHGNVYKYEIDVGRNKDGRCVRENKALIENPELYQFQFADFDGTVIHGTAYVLHQYYHRFSYFMKIFRPLFKPVKITGVNIDFGQEIGKKKGSWKGGVMAMYSPLKAATVEQHIREAVRKESPNSHEVTFMS